LRDFGPDALERTAVAAAAREFGNMGWIFREQIALDIGMDALVEEVATGFATGHLLALVLKIQQEG
jgi:hypothetical protein